MKPILILVALIVLPLWCGAQDKMPLQLKAMRSKYDDAVKAAVDPVRSRYLEDLNRARASAMGQKNLDLANAIDAEITAISAETMKGKAAVGIWVNRSGSTLEFTEKGEYGAKWSGGVTQGKWHALNSKDLEVTEKNGVVSTFRVSDDGKSITRTSGASGATWQRQP